MRSRSKVRLAAALAGALALLAVAGVAVAASGVFDPKAERESFLNDVAANLGVERSKLDSAIKEAAIARVDAALAAGRITQAQADEMKKRIEAGEVPFFDGPGMGGHHGHHGMHSLTAAAAYLGLTEAELQAQLESGKSLADVAKAEGKSVDSLEKALIADVKAKLDQAVKDGKITAAQRDEMLARFEEHVGDLVNGVHTDGPGGSHGFRHGPEGFGMGPGSDGFGMGPGPGDSGYAPALAGNGQSA
jgi:hypothetical protein